MSIYEQVLGEQFYKLHTKLQERYSFPNGKPFIGVGVMTSIQGSPSWLKPFLKLGTRRKLLFPERGENVPFRIVNRLQTGPKGEEQIHWERKFYFNKYRYFNALMSFDSGRSVIRDYLGEPPLVYADLVLLVTDEGYLKITSENQRLVIGRVEIPIPKLFQGLATVTEKYDEEAKQFLIEVIVKNPLIGTVFSYEGMFTRDISHARST